MCNVAALKQMAPISARKVVYLNTRADVKLIFTLYFLIITLTPKTVCAQALHP